MIDTYCTYIRDHVHGRAADSPPTPGEHHFVSVYLVPRLWELTGVVPNYVNPDGTKKVYGDVVYYCDGKHHFGIEVKCDVVRLTANEWNAWFVNGTNHPDLFFGVCKEGLVLLPWQEFERRYRATIEDPAALREREPGEYGPSRNVSRVADFEWSDAVAFPCVKGGGAAVRQERRFMEALERALRRVPDVAMKARSVAGVRQRQ